MKLAAFRCRHQLEATQSLTMKLSGVAHHVYRRDRTFPVVRMVGIIDSLVNS
jgi:hypothetical protein